MEANKRRTGAGRGIEARADRDRGSNGINVVFEEKRENCSGERLVSNCGAERSVRTFKRIRKFPLFLETKVLKSKGRCRFASRCDKLMKKRLSRAHRTNLCKIYVHLAQYSLGIQEVGIEPGSHFYE